MAEAGGEAKHGREQAVHVSAVVVGPGHFDGSPHRGAARYAERVDVTEMEHWHAGGIETNRCTLGMAAEVRRRGHGGGLMPIVLEHDQIEPGIRTRLAGPDEHEDAVAVGLCRQVRARGRFHKLTVGVPVAERGAREESILHVHPHDGRIAQPGTVRCLEAEEVNWMFGQRCGVVGHGPCWNARSGASCGRIGHPRVEVGPCPSVASRLANDRHGAVVHQHRLHIEFTVGHVAVLVPQRVPVGVEHDHEMITVTGVDGRVRKRQHEVAPGLLSVGLVTQKHLAVAGVVQVHTLHFSMVPRRCRAHVAGRQPFDLTVCGEGGEHEVGLPVVVVVVVFAISRPAGVDLVPAEGPHQRRLRAELDRQVDAAIRGDAQVIVVHHATAVGRIRLTGVVTAPTDALLSRVVGVGGIPCPVHDVLRPLHQAFLPKGGEHQLLAFTPALAFGVAAVQRRARFRGKDVVLWVGEFDVVF